MTVRIEDSEVREFAIELGRISSEVARKLRPVVSKGALNIKNEMQADLRASAHFGPVAHTVSYELLDDGMTAEIGPNKHFKAARLANIAYFGSGQGVYRAGPRWSQIAYYGGAKGGGTVDLDKPLEAERPRFEKAVRDVLDGLL